VREDARWIVVDHLDIRDEGRAGIKPLEQVVRQQRVLRHAPLERFGERVDVVEALPGKNAFVEEILVHVGYGGRVRVHAGVPRIGAGEERPGGARHRNAHPRLQNPVALCDPADARVDARTVQRMRDDADQLFRGVARQPRIGVERDAIAHRRENAERPDLDGEARVGGASQQPIEFLDLSAFALPPHPRVFPGVPAPVAMAQKEAIDMFGTESPIEILHSCARAREDGRVLGHLL
jgi:hypothetical protein